MGAEAAPDEPAVSRSAEREPSVTIYDVAKAAGVSPSTVSRAFSRPGKVSARTTQLVHETAERLGYRAEGIYHPPSRGKGSLLGLFVSDVTNPFYFGIIRGAEIAARELGYHVVLIDAQEDQGLERQLLRERLGMLDALVVASSRANDSELRTAAKQLPIVVLNRVVSGLTSVVPDMLGGMSEATEHLYELGHRRLLYVGGPNASWANGQRWRGFNDQCRKLGLAAQRIGPTAPTVRGGLEATEEALSRDWTAVIAYNDLIAIGLMQGLTRAGQAVPHDRSVIGFDNTFACELVTPGLTTVAAPLVRLGQQGVTRAVEQARDRTAASAPPITLPCRLIERGSTARVG